MARFFRYLRLFLMATVILSYEIASPMTGYMPQLETKDLEVAEDEAPEDKKVYCYSDDMKPYLGFASMTPYRPAAKLNASRLVPRGCTPKQIWLLLRPGSYSAHKADVARFEDQLPALKRAILKSHSLGNGKLCVADLTLLRSWKFSEMEKGPQGRLTGAGAAELAGIANRFKKEFPGIVYQHFELNLHPQKRANDRPGRATKIAFAPTRQTYESAVAFTKALYGDSWGHVGLPTTGIPLLQFFDRCLKHIRNVLMLPKDVKPYHAFMKGKVMRELYVRVRKRLGVDMSVSNIRSMYNACRYQKAWNPLKPSAWCVAFTVYDLRVLEYWEDLRMAHDHGYVHALSYKSACVLGKDIMKAFKRRVVSRLVDINSTVYFANTEAVVPFTALFRLFRDSEPLTKKKINYARLWRTSKFAGFANNYAFILSNCGRTDWWVSAALNEAPLKLPGCNSVKGCPWRKFTSLYGFQRCNFKALCDNYTEHLWQFNTWHRYYSSHNWM